MDRQRFESFLDGRLGLVLEVIVVFGVAWGVIVALAPLVGEGLLARQLVVWMANVVMLAVVWLGLHLRSQGPEHFGLPLRLPGLRTAFRAVGLSLAVFMVAVLAFVAGGIVMTAVVDTAQPADTGGYNFLQGNLPLLFVSLLGVWIVSSFGEELVYRAFLITRIAELGGGSRAAEWWAVPISAGIFGLAHFAWGATGMVQTTFMGLVLGSSYLMVRRNLWVLVLAHAYMDTLLLVQVYLGA